MKKHKVVAFVAALVVTLVGCADDDLDEGLFENDVEVRVDEEADFSSYRTFAIVDRSEVPDAFLESLSEEQLTRVTEMNQAAREELTERGLTEVEPSANPDLNVFSLAATNERAALTWDCVGGYWYGYWTWDYDPCAWMERDYESVDVRTLVNGLVDPSRQEVVFVGFVEGVESTDVEHDDVIQDSVGEIYSEYPE